MFNNIRKRIFLAVASLKNSAIAVSASFSKFTLTVQEEYILNSISAVWKRKFPTWLQGRSPVYHGLGGSHSA